MKTWIASAGAALLALASTSAMAAQVGQPAPDFQVVGADGETHQLSDFSGKNVILEWTNHDCPFVVKHYSADNMQSLQREFGEQDVVWLTVISSKPGSQGHVSADKANELTRSRDAAPRTVLLDESGDMGRAYDARVTPHMYVIDQEGTLVYAGGIDSIPSTNSNDIPRAEPYLKVAMTEVLAGESVSNPSTRPYGCTIKY